MVVGTLSHLFVMRLGRVIAVIAVDEAALVTVGIRLTHYNSE